MEDKNTREIILQEALNLFAEKGYAAVSMRDLAAAVGIKASSIYYYFKGKQELFDALIQQANDIKDMMRMNFMKALGNVGSVAEEPFVQAGVFFLTGYFQNPQISLLLRVLECERLHNEDADKAWKDLVIYAPLEHQLEVFRILKDRNELLDNNLEALAAEYQSMGLLAYFTGDVEQLQEQLRRFYRRTFK
ncbi:MAG: TetR/AcrR family transcriptional regulator [Lachnospiraceae bacterium]|nr:TetR/AcrR family transcriptional regulator [Lachnospiraceae bacterium]